MSPRLVDPAALLDCVADMETLSVLLPYDTVQPVPPGVLRRYLDRAMGDADEAATRLSDDLITEV